jgi:hypothetical protein
MVFGGGIIFVGFGCIIIRKENQLVTEVELI